MATRTRSTDGKGARWELFEHASDIGVRGFGATLEQAFEQAALALTAVVTEPERVADSESARITCEGADPEVLLYDWLNALVAEMAIGGMLFSRHEVEIGDGRLSATVWGERVDPAKHHPAVEVKGATFTELAVKRQEGSWLVQCVLDV